MMKSVALIATTVGMVFLYHTVFQLCSVSVCLLAVHVHVCPDCHVFVLLIILYGLSIWFAATCADVQCCVSFCGQSATNIQYTMRRHILNILYVAWIRLRYS